MAAEQTTRYQDAPPAYSEVTGQQLSQGFSSEKGKSKRFSEDGASFTPAEAAPWIADAIVGVQDLRRLVQEPPAWLENLHRCFSDKISTKRHPLLPNKKLLRRRIKIYYRSPDGTSLSWAAGISIWHRDAEWLATLTYARMATMFRPETMIASAHAFSAEDVLDVGKVFYLVFPKSCCTQWWPPCFQGDGRCMFRRIFATHLYLDDPELRDLAHSYFGPQLPGGRPPPMKMCPPEREDEECACYNAFFTLLSPKVQESYYTQITARYLAFCTAAGDRDNLQKQFARLSLTGGDSKSSRPLQLQPLPSPLLSPSPQTEQPASLPEVPTRDHPPKPSETERPHPSSSSSSSSAAAAAEAHPDSEQHQHLSQILSALRKLREALVASNRRDHFAVQVYLFSARLGILASAYETYYPALLQLLRWRSTTTTTTTTTNATSTTYEAAAGGNRHGNVAAAAAAAANDDDDGALTSLERQEVVGYLVLDAACRRGDLAGAYRLRHEQGLRDGRVDGALRALAADNWVAWRRVRRQVDGYRARLMDFAEARVVVLHTLKAFARAYHSVPLGVLEEQTGCAWADLKERFGVGWELDAGNVVIRKVKGR
ncbi:hypothetical protein VTG60DRAFT_1981 [Thermothelomyces hinnuleus]